MATATESKVLGWVQAVQGSLTPPRNRKMLWYDENPSQRVLKIWNRILGAWEVFRPEPIEVVIGNHWGTALTVVHNLGVRSPTLQVLTGDGTLIAPTAVRYTSNIELIVTLPANPNPDGAQTGFIIIRR